MVAHASRDHCCVMLSGSAWEGARPTTESKTPAGNVPVARRGPCFLYNVQVLRLAVALLAASLALWPQDTRVILLGTGTPNPEPDRMGPSVAVVSRDRVYIVDCGP